MIQYLQMSSYFSLMLAAYWLPLLVATARRVPAIGQVAVVNGFLGWTGIGWVVALTMAFRTPKDAPTT